MIEDFINAMSVLYNKGHFILGAEMEENFNYALYPDVGTEMGMCKTIKPMVSLNINTLKNAMPELSGWFSALAADPEGEGRLQDKAGAERL